MVAAGFDGGSALIVARSAHGPVGHANGVNQFVVAARMTNADGPRLAVRVEATEIEVATGVDGKIGERLKLACGEIDRQSLGDRTEIENQGAEQCDGLAIRVETNISIVDGISGFNRGSDILARTILAVESARLHRVTDGWIKCAVAFPCDRHSKMNCFVQDRADRDGNADLRGEPHQFTLGLKSCAGLFNAAKPRERAIEGFFPMMILPV